MTVVVDAKDAPENALQTLIKFSLKGDLEIAERLSLLHLTNKILALEENQRDLIDRAQVELGLGTLFRTYSEALDPMEVILSGVGQTRSEEPEEEKELVNARSTLVHLLSDISAQPEFAKKYEISMDPSTIAWKLKQAMISPVLNISQAACLMLGNLACTDDICIRMVKNIKIHEAASMVLKDAKDVQLLHAVLGLLRNLALPKDNKDSLATVGVIENLQRCWSMDINPQIQLAAASLIRQLAAGSITNTRRLLLVSRSLNDDNDATQTQLMCLMKVYEKSDQLPMRTEIARTIVALLRSIYSQVVDEATRTSILAEFYSSSNNLELPLIGMITQTQHHVVRSEGWFALGLLSKDRSGRGMILRHVSEPGFMDLLRNTILESVPLNTQPELKGVEVGSAPAAPHNGITSTKDRENAMVVVYELTKFEVSSSAMLCFLLCYESCASLCRTNQPQGVDNASINEELRLDLFQLLGYESDKHV